MKVLLINPPFFDVYRGFKEAAKLGASYPPIGLLYLASSALRAGHRVELCDVDVEGLNIEELIEKVKDFGPDVVALTATTPTYVGARDIIKEIKRRLNIITALGGYHLTILLDEILKELPELDFGIYGEGETTLVKLLNCLENKGNPADVKGVIWRDRQGSIKINPRRPLIPNLDTLPFPARHLLKKGCYLWSVPKRGVQEIALLVTKRGCPFRCKFCSAHSMFLRQIRYRSVKNVVDEIEHIIKDRGISHILFEDDTLILKRERMKAICQEIKKRNLVFTWEGMARANLIDFEILKMMHDVGLRRVSFGIESGDQNILNLEQKGITLEQIRQAYKWAKQAGIETRGSAIIGHPGETITTALRTIRFLRSLKHLDQVYINIMVPYPGTEIYDIAKEGRHGMRLLCDDFSEFVRYNNSVIEVNNLTRRRLIFLQKFGLLYFYLTPRRIIYNISRAGLKTGFKNVWAFAKGILSK